MGVLYLVPTPIGNYEDMTLRGVDVLNSCDFIYSNDNKVKGLLDYYNIEKVLKLIDKEEILHNLEDGKMVAIINEEGYAGVDVITHDITKEALSNGSDVIAIPGANHLLTGLVTSGIPCDKFLYYGFLSKDTEAKRDELASIIDVDRTIVLFEYCENLKDTLDVLYDVFKNRAAVLCFNLTKENEKYIRFNLGDEIEKVTTDEKIVIVIEGAKIKSSVQRLNEMDIEDHYKYYLKQGLDNKEAMKKVAKDRGVSKSDIYRVINK